MTSSRVPLVSISYPAARRNNGSTLSTKLSTRATSSGRLPYWLVAPEAQSFHDNRSRCAQQNDEVELGKELWHILRTPAHEQHIGVLGGQKSLNAVLSPHPIPVPVHRRH